MKKTSMSTYVFVFAAFVQMQAAQGQTVQRNIVIPATSTTGIPVGLPEIKFVGKVKQDPGALPPWSLQDVMKLANRMTSTQIVALPANLPAELSAAPIAKVVLCVGSQDYCANNGGNAAEIALQVADRPNVDGTYPFSLHVDMGKLADTGFLSKEGVNTFQNLSGMTPEELQNANLEGIAKTARTRLALTLTRAFPSLVFDYTTIFSIGSGGPTINVNVASPSVFGGFFKRAKEILDCIGNAIRVLVDNGGDVEYSVTIHMGVNPSVDVTISGSAPGPVVSQFVGSVADCF